MEDSGTGILLIFWAHPPPSLTSRGRGNYRGLTNCDLSYDISSEKKTTYISKRQ
uniref:Uncharacterized protein n=1 Tax=Anguilla anguilla TaxID=7936 RepID=A0A0E9TA93_ANGAN